MIHPFQDGQVILHIDRNYLGVSTPTRWVNVGYGSGDTNLLSRTPSFSTVFPLETGTNYEVKTSVSSSGLISVWFDTSLVATGRVTTALSDRFRSSHQRNLCRRLNLERPAIHRHQLPTGLAARLQRAHRQTRRHRLQSRLQSQARPRNVTVLIKALGHMLTPMLNSTTSLLPIRWGEGAAGG